MESVPRGLSIDVEAGSTPSTLSDIYTREVLAFNRLFSSRSSSSSSWGRLGGGTLTRILGLCFGSPFGTGVAIPSARNRSTIRNGD